MSKEKIKVKKIALVKAQYNHGITNAMLKECQKFLSEQRIYYDTYSVAGSFEIPYLIKKISNRYDGFIAIACLIKGETLHFEYIAQAVSLGLMKLAIEQNKPIGFAVLTCLNKKQAKARVKKVNDAALAVLSALSV